MRGGKKEGSEGGRRSVCKSRINIQCKVYGIWSGYMEGENAGI